MTKPKLGYSVKEAAISCAVSQVFLRRRIKKGTLPAVRLGRRIVILAEALNAMMEQGRRDFLSGR